MMRRRDFLSALAQAGARRPNIVFVLVDDLRWDELGCTGHQFAQTPHADRLAREGVNFVNAFAATPLCSPSRASFLTGLYPHRHGIIDNTDRSRQSHALVTWPRLLHDSGYATAFIGKWHMGNDDSPRPGFDQWVSFPGQGECNDPILNVNGRAARRNGYITDLLTAHAVEFVERSETRPFCLYLAHKAIHPNIQQLADGSVVGGVDDAEAFIPAARHRQLYSGLRLPRRRNYNQAPRGKPALERSLDLAKATDDETIRNRMRMMKAVDEGLGRILSALETKRQLDDTLVVFTSDHGYFYGEHGLGAERRLAYEEAIRIPLLMRYPKAFRARSRRTDFALSIDIAPTMLELAGAPATNLQGRSLLEPTARDAFLVEYYSDTVFARIRNMGYRAVRTDRWKYIHYRELTGMDELYDLRRDPHELDNRIAKEPRMLREMQQRLTTFEGSALRSP